MSFLESAHKHGVQNYDVVYVLENFIAYFELEGKPKKKMKLLPSMSEQMQQKCQQNRYEFGNLQTMKSHYLRRNI